MAEQARQQQAIDEARARFEFGQQAPTQALRDYSAIAAGSILPPTTTATQTGGDPSFMQRAVGGGLLGLGAYGGLQSAGLAASGYGAAGYTGNAIMGTGLMGAGGIGLALGLASLFD
jgi:hypothetical protein